MGINLDKYFEGSEFNKLYFEKLYEKLDSNIEKQLGIHVEGELESNVYPTAIAPSEMISNMPLARYDELEEGENLPCSLWIRKMHGGIGSSIKREKYLSRILGQTELGSKSTDLFIETSKGKQSIAEASLTQAILYSENKVFDEVICQDLYNEEGKKRIQEIWKKPSYFDSSVTNEEFFERSESLQIFNPLLQMTVPTVGKDGELTTERVAPAGHGFFGVEALLACLDESIRPKAKNSLICVIGNGEDINSTPDRKIVNWMIREDIPIAMLTTTKTKIDLKGGQIAIWDKKEKGRFYTIIEKAQAESFNQLDLFYKLGLRDGDKESFFNTNVVLINYDSLIKKLSSKLDDSNHEDFISAIMPDLIKNNKKQVIDGIEKEFTQLEGAMGSTFLNLDNYWRETHGEGLIHFLNVGKKNRTKFFCPIKSAFDFWMLYHSDRFAFDEESFKLKDLNPGKLPSISLKDDYYKEVENVLDSFSNTKISKLESLVVEGKRDFSNQEISGKFQS